MGNPRKCACGRWLGMRNTTGVCIACKGGTPRTTDGKRNRWNAGDPERQQAKARARIAERAAECNLTLEPCPDCGEQAAVEPPCRVVAGGREMLETVWRCPACGPVRQRKTVRQGVAV